MNLPAAVNSWTVGGGQHSEISGDPRQEQISPLSSIRCAVLMLFGSCVRDGTENTAAGLTAKSPRPMHRRSP